MGQYTSYYLYQKYEQRDGQEPIPVYPNVWSLDGDGTMPRVVKLDDDPDCGYAPIDVIYRWINMDISIDYLCENYNKYYKQKKQVSYDSGTTWQDVIPYEYQKGSLYEVNSVDCGYLYLERWVDSGTTCSGYDKYILQIKQVSNDGGSTWTTTSDTRLGELIAKDSTDCGYVPPILDAKFSANYLNGRTYQVACNSNETLTSGETRPYDYSYYEMTSAEIGDCVTSIGNRDFYDCTSLTSVTIGNNVTSIGNSAFVYCYSLPSIVIPDSVTSIGQIAFARCTGLTSVTIGSGVTSIGQVAFGGCSGLTSIVIPDSVTSIGNGAFYQCTGLTSCTIGSGVTSIGDGAFYFCRSLTSINIPSGVTSIDGYAFEFCYSLTSVVIPSGVTSIGNDVFWGCTGLSSVTVLATTPPALGTDSFGNTNDCPIYVPSQSVSAYKSATNWSTYASRIRAIPN